MRYTFKTPYEFDDTEYSEIEFDLDGVKGSDLSAVKKQFAAAGHFSPVPTADSDFCALLLARVTKMPLEFYSGLPAKDYCAITQMVSNFLLA